MSRKVSHLKRCDSGHQWSVDVPGSAAEHTALHDGAGFRVTPIDPKTGEPEEESAPRPPSGAKVLMDLATQARIKLIRDQYGEPFAKFPDGRVLPLSGGGIGEALTVLYYQYTEGNPPPKGAVKEVCDVLRAVSVSSAVTEPVYLRFGPLPDGRGVAIDLGTSAYTAIVIRKGSWAIEPHPVNFRRTKAMEALPEPDPDRTLLTAGHSLEGALKALLNVSNEDDARLLAAFLVALLKPNGPFLGVAFTGPAGAAKTFASRILRRLIDPVNQDGGGGVRSLPRDADAFAAIVTSNAVPVFDNLSGASPEQADMLAQLMTGYSNEKRRLYTDDETFERSAKRPVILTGIDITDRSDLLSRLLVVELEAMGSYATEELLWERFAAMHAAILGAVCDAVAAGYAHLDEQPRDGWRVRMADMVRFVTAAESALGWSSGWTENALAESQGEAVAAVLSTQSWYPALVALLEAHGGSYTGSATDLLDGLRTRYALSQAERAGRNFVENGDQPRSTDATWPKNGNALTSTLKRNVSGLARVGITFTNGKSNGSRVIRVESAPPDDE